MKRLVVILCTGALFAVSVVSTRGAGQAAPATTRRYTAPRTASGQPDLQGVWQVMNTAAWDIQDHSGQRFPGLPARFSTPAGKESWKETRSHISRGR